MRPAGESWFNLDDGQARTRMVKEKSSLVKYLLSPAGVFVLSLAAVVLISLQFSSFQQARDRLRFETRADIAGFAIETRIETYIAMLRATAGFFAASETVSLNEFRIYVSRLRLQEAYSGIQGIGLSLRLRPDEVEGFEQRMRSAGMEDFRVWPEGSRPEVHTIAYLEPMDARNREALGYDMATEEVRREAMDAARDRGLPVASGRVTLVQEITEDVQAGFLIYVPIYRGGETPGSIEERRERLIGYVYAPFRVGELLRSALGNSPLAVDVTAYEGLSPQPETLLYRSTNYATGERPARFAPRFLVYRKLDVAGRQWTMRYTDGPAFDASSARLPVPVIFLSGVLLSFLLTAITWFEAKAHRKAVRVAAELRRSEQELKESRERLIENDRRKDEFLAMLAHELRNPLAPIYNALQVIRMSGFNRDIVDEFSGIMQSQVDQLVRLVDDLMDVSRITRGKIELTKAPTGLGSIIDNALQVVGPAIDEKGQSLVLELPSEELWLDADFARASQIFVNLLGNASKYTPDGGRIRVFAESRDRFVRIGVEDNGIGIPPDRLEYVFEPFTQLDSSVGRKQGGLGIGLMLVRRLAGMHGGRVEVESAGEGKGSTFYVCLPRGTVPSISAS
ncbi:MAG: hypothetical protein EOM26_11525 [Alphaproteobacteria bacterium]|nr:hypothetical protein [Alphaproteobacteria bacterium]